MNDNLTRSCVKVTTGNEIKIVNYKEDIGCGNKFICEQIGNGCKYLDEVRPGRLYKTCNSYCYSGIMGSNVTRYGTKVKDKNSYEKMLHDRSSSDSTSANNMDILIIPGTMGPFMRMLPRNLGFHYPKTPYYNGSNIIMLVDDLGYDKKLPDNPIASWLYGADLHGNRVKGDVLFVGLTYDFSDYCGLSRKDLKRLVAKLYKLKMKMEASNRQ